MSNGLLNVGTRALLVNQAALQTAGNNIANVNTPGYSRQSVVLQAVQGQYTGGGYVGKGVEMVTIERAYSSFLTKQTQLTASVAAADNTRASKMMALEDLFPSGSAGIGSAVNEMLNAFSDVAASPSDMTARSVVLQRADEMATRFRDTSSKLDDLSYGANQQMRDSVNAINNLSTRIAALNEQVARAQGSGQSPNDLLDARDSLLLQLNSFVQTTTVPAGDGTLGVFVGSQPLVLGTHTSMVSIANDDFGDPSKLKLAINNGGLITTVDENSLGGGSVAGLLRFNNSDLAAARNLVGRMAVALNTAVNEQHRLGIDSNGNTGADFFVPITLPDGFAASTNNGSATIGTTVNDASKMVASDYELRFGAGGAVDVIRLSDGQATSFAGLPVTLDGLTFNMTMGGTLPGDRFIVKPFSSAAGQLKTAFSTASSLAVASPVEARAGAANTGTLAVQSVAATQADANLTASVTLTFTAAGTFDVVGAGTGNPTGVTYTPGQTISYNGWELTLKGTPKVGDTITVQAGTAGFAARDAGNATALKNIRDATMFDGATVADGYAGVMSKIGVLAQGAKYAADVSSSIATTAASSNASVSGVNLDEEAAKLLQFQQAYQASAKMIQISQAIFDSLINGLGR
jgi:flagellar hook-associated protein 1 FlgK